MSQMALFSSDTDDPSVSDVAGLLACSGQTVPMAGGTRVSVVVDAQWRARALAQELELIGLAVEIARPRRARRWCAPCRLRCSTICGDRGRRVR